MTMIECDHYDADDDYRCDAAFVMPFAYVAHLKQHDRCKWCQHERRVHEWATPSLLDHHCGLCDTCVREGRDREARP